MKWIVKEKSLSDLINFARKNLKSENYIFITTYEILSEQKDNFQIFCKKIPLNYVVECFVEKTEKSFKSGMAIFKIKKEYILEKELASFSLIKEENNPTNIIPIHNTLDYEYSENTSNRDEIGWFLRKIFGFKPKMRDHYLKNIVSENNSTHNVRGVPISSSVIDYDPPLPNDRPSSHFFLYQSQKYGSKHETEKQKSCLLNAIKLEFDNFFIHHELGLFYYRNASYLRAIEYFQNSEKINPQFSLNKKMLSYCYFGLGKTSLAISKLEQINFEKQPDIEKLDMELSLAIYKTFTQDYGEAINHFEELHHKYKNASQTWPEFIPSLFQNWITCLKKDGRVDDKIRVLKFALNEIPSSYHNTPNYGMFVHDLVLSFIESNQIDNAIDVCNDGLNKDKENWPVLLLLAVCNMDKNEPDNAISNLSIAKSILEKNYTYEIMSSRLQDITNFIEIIKIGLDEIKTKEITETILENYPSPIESAWELQLKQMGAVPLTSSKEENDEIAITKLNECKSYLFWVDPYFESAGFKWISEAYVKKNSSIKKIEILAKFNQHSPQEDLYKIKFKESFNELKIKLNEKNISLELRICFESKFARDIHARYWYFYENQPPSVQSSWSIPSIMNFKRGQKESINPTPFRKDNFDEIWKYSLNFEKDYDEIISKYQEWRKKQTT